MKKNQFCIVGFLLSFISLLFTIRVTKVLYYSDIDKMSMLQNITYLSSDYFDGRLTGTQENFETSMYIKNIFEKNGLSPIGKTYLDSFEVTYPNKIEGEPSLIVKNDFGDIIHTFKYGEDYKEDMMSFRDRETLFSKNNLPLFTSHSINIQSGSKNIIFYSPKSDDLNFRSSFDVLSDFSLVILVKKDTLESLKKYINEGYYIYVSIPFTEKTSVSNNVSGIIHGKNKDLPPLILTAHFDGLGSDSYGNVYPGALDNASGTSLLIEIMNFLSSLPKPDRDIIFVFFNAEELGLIGSKSFVSKYESLLKNGTNINFDMIGVKNFPLSLLYSKDNDNSKKFTEKITKYITQSNQDYNILYENSSDHASFQDICAVSITLIHSNIDMIHTSQDTISNINMNSVNDVFKISMNMISDLVYSKTFYIKYSIPLSLFLLSLSLIFLSLIFNSGKVKKLKLPVN